MTSQWKPITEPIGDRQVLVISRYKRMSGAMTKWGWPRLMSFDTLKWLTPGVEYLFVEMPPLPPDEPEGEDVKP